MRCASATRRNLSRAEPSSIRAIAEQLGVTHSAVKQHLLKLYDKFRLPDDGERRRVRPANDAIALGVVERSDGGERDSKASQADAPLSIREARSLRSKGSARPRGGQDTRRSPCPLGCVPTPST